jgi:DNA polymerase I
MTTPFYVAAREPASDLNLTRLQSVYDQYPDVGATKMVTRRPGFRRDEEVVLAVDGGDVDRENGFR